MGARTVSKAGLKKVTATMALLMLATACGGGESATSAGRTASDTGSEDATSTGSDAGSENVQAGGEVRMVVNLTDNLTKQFWNDLVAPFEEQTGVDVKIEGPTGTNVSETFSAQLAAGTAPDVIQSIFADDQIAPELLDLSDQPWIEGTPLLDTYSLDGKNYVVGVGSQAQSLVYYNKTAFEEAGITSTPQTWEDFEAALGLLADAGYNPLQTAGQWMTGLQLQQLWHPTLNTTHPEWQISVSEGELALGEVFQPMFAKYDEWLEQGYIQQDDVGLDPSTADANFLEGEVGMYPLGSWLVATIDGAGDLPFEVGVFSPPVDQGMDYPGPQGATMAYPYMVYKGSEQTENALLLIEYLVTDEDAIEAQLVADGVFRAGVDAQESPVGQEIQTIMDEAPALVAVGEGAGDVRLPVVGLNARFTEIVQSLYTGSGADEAADELNTWAEQNS